MAAPHRAWRVWIDAVQPGTDGYVGLGELILATELGGASVTVGGTPIAIGALSSFPADLAFDGDPTYDAHSWVAAWTSAKAWIGYDFGAGNEKEIVEIGMVCPSGNSYAGIPQRMPRIFRVEYSDDLDTWHLASSDFDQQGGWAFGELRRFALFRRFLAGTALLDTGLPATRVLVRDWVTHQHMAAVVPAADGTWQALVPDSTYDVTVIGPEGYQPVTHGPLVPVDVE